MIDLYMFSLHKYWISLENADTKKSKLTILKGFLELGILKSIVLSGERMKALFLVGTKIFWWSEVPASVAGGELSGIAGRYITRDTRTLVHYSRHRPQWPVTKSQEINVFGRCLNILHTFPRGNPPNCKSLKVQKI